MHRSIIKVPQGDGLVEHIVRLEDDPSPSDDMASYMALGMFLQIVAADPNLLRNVGDCPSKIRFYRTDRWICESSLVLPSEE